ncbi:MAG TPA: phosphotransferase family protein [Steroidobacteraceae bacterium]|nr:phosphotransferase family protein [Steroidobacteraceae bacterium]
MVKLLNLPGDRCLEALRHALKLVIAPELQSPLAKHYAHLAEIVLARWIALEVKLPQIERSFADANDAHLRRAREALRGMAPEVLSGEAGMTLPTVLNRLAAFLPKASAHEAATIRALLRDAVASDAAARKAFEVAVAEVTRAVESGESPKQFSIDPERLESYLQERFAAQGPVRVRSVNPLPGGRSKETVLFEIEAHPTLPPSMVIRMDAGRYGTSVSAEFPLLVALHRAKLPVPEPLWLEERAEVLGGAFIVTRRMAGAPPGTLWDVSGASQSIGLALADVLAKIHATPLRHLSPSNCDASQPLVRAMLADNEARWRAAMPLPSVAMEAAYCWMAEKAPGLDAPASLVHGDPGFHNMIVKDGKLECLLDWEFAHPGDPAEDLAYCRPSVEQIMPWADFMTQYRGSGGPEINAERLQFFEIWRCLRNATLAANMLYDVSRGAASGLEMAAVAVNTYPRFEAQLASSLERVMALTAAEP